MNSNFFNGTVALIKPTTNFIPNAPLGKAHKAFMKAYNHLISQGLWNKNKQ